MPRRALRHALGLLDLLAVIALVVAATAGVHRVMGETKLLRRMVRNLLENALRYGAGSAVVVRAGSAPWDW